MTNLRKEISAQFNYYFYFSWGFNYFSAGYLCYKKLIDFLFNELYIKPKVLCEC